jgi:hypothetical protein
VIGMNEYLAIGGVTVSATEAREALTVLQESKGVMIRQPLLRAGNPLADMDYHAIADAERELSHELVLPPGTHRTPTPHEKTAVIHHLQRVLAE